MTTLRDTGLLLGRRLRATARQPVWVIAGLATPLLYLALFAPLLASLDPAALGGRPVIDMFLPGMLVLFAYGCGTGVGWLVIADLNSGVIERLRVSPASRLAILLGSVLHDVVMFVLPAILVILVAWPFGFQVHLGGLAALLVLLGLLTALVSAVSAALGLRLKQIGSLAAVITGTQLPLTLLAGVLLPIDLGPAWLRVLAHFDPLFYATEAARALAAGVFNADVAIGFGLTGALLALALTWSTRVYRQAVA